MGFYEEVWVLGYLLYMLERGTPPPGQKKNTVLCLQEARATRRISVTTVDSVSQLLLILL